MSRKVLFSYLVAIASLAAVPLNAADNPAENRVIPEPLKEYYYSGLAPNRLAYVVDLWYDAVLKGDQPRVSAREKDLLKLIQQDIDSTNIVLEQFRQLLWQAQVASVVMPDTGHSLSDDLPLLEYLDRDRYSYELDLCKTKEKLVAAIRHSNAFSNKYRLISDYIEVLRRQIGLPKLKLAGVPKRTAAKDAESTLPTDVRVSESVTDNPLEN